MGLDIVTNTMASDASNSLAANEMNMQGSLQKLSSGYKINSAADDPSGLVISQHLKSQIAGFQQAQANTQSDVNVVQTADGALNEVSSILQKINSLAVEAANTSATDSTAQQAAQAEVTQSLSSISNIASSTVYGDNQLLVNGTSNTVDYTFQVGADNTSASQISFSVTALNLANLGLINNSLTVPSGNSEGVASVSGNVASGAHTIVLAGGTAATTTGNSTVVAGTTSSFAITAGTFTIALNGGTTVSVNLSGTTTSLAALETAITGALATAGYSATSVTIGAVTNGSSIALTLTDATSGPGGSITLGGTAALTGLGFTAGTSNGGAVTASLDGGATVALTTAQATGTFTLSDASGTSLTVTAGAGGLAAGTLTATQTYADANATTFSVTASNAVTLVQNAIQTVSSMRGTLGAYQDELQGISDNETVMTQNLQASNAQITDTNMASEMVNFTQDQVLVQAGVAMLAQANQIPQYVLKLL